MNLPLLALNLPANEWRRRRLWPLLVMMVFFFQLHAFHFRPLETDSFEYVEVAFNYLRTGQAIETHLQNYVFPHEALPHPAAQRATLYTWLILPLVWLGLDLYWNLAIPALLAYSMLIWTTHRMASRHFPARVVNTATLLLMFHPRLINNVAFEPQPDILQAAFFFAALVTFLEGRYTWAGLWTGLAMAVKQNAIVLVPVFGLFLLLRRREDWRSLRLWAGVLLMAAVYSPFPIRNVLVFGNPVYTESLAGRKYLTVEEWTERNILKFLFSLRDQRPANALPQGLPWKVRWELLVENCWMVLTGARVLDFYPGFFSLFFLWLPPFLFYEWWVRRKNEAVFLLGMAVLGFLLFALIVQIGYEDRYLSSLLAPAFILSVAGLSRWASMRPRFLPGIFLAVLFFSEQAGMMGIFVFNALGPGHPHMALYQEYTEAGNWLQKHTPADAVVMAFPITAASLVTDRKVIPLPYGGAREMLAKASEYRAEYLFYLDFLREFELAESPYLERVFVGEAVSVWRILSQPPPTAPPPEALTPCQQFMPLPELYDVLRERVVPMGSLASVTLYHFPLAYGWLFYLLMVGAGYVGLALPAYAPRLGLTGKAARIVTALALTSAPFILGGVPAVLRNQEAVKAQFLPFSLSQFEKCVEANGITSVYCPGLTPMMRAVLQWLKPDLKLGGEDAPWKLELFLARAGFLENQAAIEKAVEQAKEQEQQVRAFLEAHTAENPIRIGGGVLLPNQGSKTE